MFEITLFMCFVTAGIFAYVVVPAVLAKTRQMSEQSAKGYMTRPPARNG